MGNNRPFPARGLRAFLFSHYPANLPHLVQSKRTFSKPWGPPSLFLKKTVLFYCSLFYENRTVRPPPRHVPPQMFLSVFSDAFLPNQTLGKTVPNCPTCQPTLFLGHGGPQNHTPKLIRANKRFLDVVSTQTTPREKKNLPVPCAFPPPSPRQTPNKPHRPILGPPPTFPTNQFPSNNTQGPQRTGFFPCPPVTGNRCFMMPPFCQFGRTSTAGFAQSPPRHKILNCGKGLGLLTHKTPRFILFRPHMQKTPQPPKSNRGKRPARRAEISPSPRRNSDAWWAAPLPPRNLVPLYTCPPRPSAQNFAKQSLFNQPRPILDANVPNSRVPLEPRPLRPASQTGGKKTSTRNKKNQRTKTFGLNAEGLRLNSVAT